MRAWICTAAAVLLVGLAWFGRSAWGGWFLLDESPSLDIYHLSTLYERWAHYLRAGELASWMPEFAGGYPAPASWMYGLYYPGLLLFAVLPADMAWTWTCVLHMVLAAVGVHRLVRAETDDDVAAVTAGVAFGLSELLIGRAIYGHLNLIAPLAWTPWAFLHVRGLATGRRDAGVWCAICATLGLLAGHVQVWFYFVPALLAYALVVGARSQARGRYVAHLLATAAIVACLTAVQWLPAIELSMLSRRAAASSADVADFSAPAHVLVAKLFPGALGFPPDTDWGPATAEHEFGAAGGLLLVVLALPALLRRRREDWLWGGLAVAGLLLAPGVNHPLSELLNALPPMRWGRTPARALFLTTLGGAVLAGRGLAEWRRAARESPGTLRRLVTTAGAATAGIAVVGAGALFVLLRDDGIGEHANLVSRAIVTSLVLAGAALAVPVVARTRPRAWWAAPALVVVGTVLGGAPPARTIRADFYTTDWAAMLPVPLREHRFHLLTARLPNVERQGLRTLRQICYVDAHWYHEYMADPTPERALWLDVGAELVGIPRERVMTGALGADDLIGKPFDGLGPGVVFDAARVEPDTARVLAAIDAGERALYLAEPADGLGGAESRIVPAAHVARIASDTPERTAFDVDTPVAGWLLVSEKHYPGWTATVNEADAEIHRANVMFRAVRVPAGHSIVVFTYRPWTVRAGALLLVVGLVAGIGLVVRSRRRPPADAEIPPGAP